MINTQSNYLSLIESTINKSSDIYYRLRKHWIPAWVVYYYLRQWLPPRGEVSSRPRQCHLRRLGIFYR